MAVNPIFRQQPVRMMGMASGIDTESIIQATLRMHQFKIDRQLKNRTLIEWKQKAHNDIKDQIKSLKDTYLSNLGSKTMMNRNTYNTNLATAMQGGKASTAITVSTSAMSSLGSLTITQVKSLAKGTSITSLGSVSASGSGFALTSTLGSLSFGGGGISFGNYLTSVTGNNGPAYLSQSAYDNGNGVSWGNWTASGEYSGNNIEVTRTESSGDYNFTIKYGGEDITGDLADIGGGKLAYDLEDGTRLVFNQDGKNLSYSVEQKELDEDGQETGEWVPAPALTNIGLAFSRTGTIGAVDAGGDPTTDTITLTQDDNGVVKNGNKTINAGSFSGEADLVVNGTTVKLTSDMTISDMINKVNKEVSGVTMSYDRMSDTFAIKHNTIGSSGTVAVGGSAGVVESLFGGTATEVNAKAVQGTQTEVVFSDGTSAKSNTNTIEYRGITIRVNHTTEELTGDNVIEVTVKRDTDKAVNAIKDFIDSYNTIIKKLEDLLNERKTNKEAGYVPLTDEEKASMTEKQIEEWEAIAKKGILRNDRSIQDLVTNLRAEFFKEIEGTGYTASQLGLSTGNYFGGTGGQIIIDEEGEKKLRAALEADPDRVTDVFVKIGTDSNGNPVGQGLMHKIEKRLNDFIRLGGTQENTLSALEKSYNEMNARIAKLEERMWAEEDKLYRQFAAMETALSNMQSQGDWFSAMLGNK